MRSSGGRSYIIILNDPTILLHVHVLFGLRIIIIRMYIIIIITKSRIIILLETTHYLHVTITDIVTICAYKVINSIYNELF